MKPSSSYKEELLESLKDSEEAVEYLNAALEDEDPRVFLLALQDVMEAKSVGMTQLAEKTRLDRSHLYRMLSQTGNPEFNSLHTLLAALGFHLAVSLNKSVSHAA